MSNRYPESIYIKAPARLHLGFLDLHGGLGRSFGSVGLCIEGLYSALTISPASSFEVVGPSAGRVMHYTEQITSHFSLDNDFRIDIKQSIPEHMGLGSGTQLSLATGIAITQMKGLNVSIEEIATALGRGARSGIGIGAFKYGGFLVDGGRGEESIVPPITARMPFPESWRIVLLLDHDFRGVHGQEEIEAFRNLPKMTDTTVDHLCRIVLMQVLPALAENNCDAFGAGITEIQNSVGDHFSHAQGGRYASQAVASVLQWAEAHAAVSGIGQSSWGPTGFMLFANETQAYQTMREAKQQFEHLSQIEYRIVSARNQMAEVVRTEANQSNRLNVQKFC